MQPARPAVPVDDAPIVEKTGWPEWLNDHYSRFLDEHGTSCEWKAVLAEWVALERVLLFANPVC